MIAAILQSAGYKTGLYTSPHLKNFTERIKINGAEIPESVVVEFVQQYRRDIEAIKPSFFEVTVGMAFDYFARERVDIAIIETGLGGRLDSTNIITPLVSLITNISFDHQAILGNTLQQIAGEKAGIIKPGIPVVISETQQEVQQVFENKAKECNASITFADQEFSILVNDQDIPGLTLSVVKKDNSIFLLDLYLSLGGDYQVKNIAGVVGTIEILKTLEYDISLNHIRSGLGSISGLTGLKGRWQQLADNPITICDTGHNIAGIQFIVEQISKIKHQRLFWIFGVVNDKDIAPVLSILPKDAVYIFCQAAIPRAMDATELTTKAASFGLSGTTIQDVNAAYTWARNNAKEADLILVGGSTFVVAELNDL